MLNLNQIFFDIVFQRFGSQLPKYVAIYGAGQNGMVLKKYLQAGKVAVDFFCDNDPRKQGTLLEGVLCLSLNELCRYKDEVVVFVSPSKSDDMREDLENLQFPHVVSSDLLKLLHFIPQTTNDEAYQRFPRIGHFYSLYPDLDEIMKKEDQIFNPKKDILDIDFNEEVQLSMLNQMIRNYSTIPDWEDITVELGSTPLRYRRGNSSLTTADAVGLHCMLRILNPARVIEVGSGFTSAVMLDTNEFYMDNQIQLTFIEPYPNRLKSVLKQTDRIHLIESGLEDVPLEAFEHLEDGDILFIDSTHVSKINSDVNYLFFEIFPRLKKGVYIHIHDILYPFEYPKEWIVDGVVWNELYLLRAFLQNNSAYSIVFFQNMMEQKHKDLFLENWPLNEPVSGGSIWLRKLVD